MRLKVLRKTKILLVCFVSILSSCQVTTTGEEKTSTLDSTENMEITEKEQKVESKEDLEDEPKPQKQEKKIETDNISSIQKTKDDKRILDFFADLFGSESEEQATVDKDELSQEKEIIKLEKPELTKKKQVMVKENNNTTIYKPEKPKDEKRILDFFEKNQVDDTDNRNTTLYKPEKPKDEKRILDFFSKFFDSEDDINPKSREESSDSGKNLKAKVEEEVNLVNEPAESIDETMNKKDLLDLKKIEIKKISENLFESIDDDSNFTEDKLLLEDSTHNQKQELEKEIENKEELAFLDINKDKPRGVLKRNPSNFVGLLLPLTGEKRSAGNLVLNTFRYSLAVNPKNIVFKIYDTKGTAEGAIEAAKKGKKDKVQTFIGPVFSYETSAIKSEFLYDKSIKFFSLSPDLSNVADNIIISGQNPKDQISCIVEDLKLRKIKKILLIHHDDRYGQIIKSSLEESLLKFGLHKDIELSFFSVFPSQNINKDIMEISNFEKRKLALKQKRTSIQNNKTLSKSERKRELKKIERQLTYGVPFDSIIIASEGNRLVEILSHLAFYDMNSSNTVIYGTSLWEDTIKNDKVFDNTYFVSNLKSKQKSFVNNYKEVFSKDPNSVNFHLFDLIELVNDYKLYEKYPEGKVYSGKFTNSKIDSGFLKRETFIKKNKGKNKTENTFSCQLNVI